MNGDTLKQFEFVQTDIELFDQKPVLMNTWKCDVHQVDNKMKTGDPNCIGCESLIQCCKLNTVIELFARFNMHQVRPEDFRSAVQLIIKECKTQSEVMAIASSALIR